MFDVSKALSWLPALQALDLDGAAGDHYLPATLGNTMWGRLPGRKDQPVLRVRPGEVVTFDTISHEGILEDQGRDPLAFFGSHGVPADGVLTDAITLAASAVPRDLSTDGPHVVTGPVEILGAEPGDLLAMTVLDLRMRVPYGVVSSRHGKGALPGEVIGDDPVYSAFCLVEPTGSGEVGCIPLREDAPEELVRFPLRPFLGTMGVAADTDERPHSVPPGAHGGNLDIALLVPGTTLYLPVQVPGALAYVGDPHFAQGNGEVALTALEAPLRASVRFDLVPRLEAERRYGPVVAPFAETPEYVVPIGLHEDLDEAMRSCVRHAIGQLAGRYGMDRRLAYAYLSAAADFDISQVVDQVKGVHARIRKADFASLSPTAAPADVIRTLVDPTTH
ncbi:acetamidase/formamidase family protein [Streptomyces sp. NPDC000880]